MSTATKERWSFLYTDNDDYEWDKPRSRVYTGTIKKCCDKMLNWATGRAVMIDYEVAAVHNQGRGSHQEQFTDLYGLDHPITELID